MCRLTGQTRFRAGFFGKLILQVEELRSSATSDVWADDTEYKVWRDATTKDVLRGEIENLKVYV